MRIALALIALALAGVAAGSAPAAPPRIAIVNCDDAARAVVQPAGKLYGARLGFSWGTRAKKLVAFQDVTYTLTSKLPIFIRGGGKSFTIAIAPSWHERAGMAWDARGDARPPIAQGVRVVPADRDHDRGQALHGARAARPRLPLS